MIITIAIIIIICLILSMGALALFFWNKWKKEQDNYHAMRQIANTNAKALQRSEEKLEFTKRFDQHVWSIEFNKRLDAEKERDALQDFKSSKLCPHNDHIWVDGVCKRCGRAQPLPDLPERSLQATPADINTADSAPPEEAAK